jgi:hemerythrin
MELARRMYKELTDWLVNHIQRVDGQISPCMINETNDHS